MSAPHPEFPAGLGLHGFGQAASGFGAGRRQKGDVRIAILSLLATAPNNGYGLIKEISTRTGGTWKPSPGSVYPTLQQLVSEELVESIGTGRTMQYQLTRSGNEWAGLHAEELAAVWTSTAQQADAHHELRGTAMELMHAVMQVRDHGTSEQRAKTIQELENARRAVYRILADL